ncbi:MAG: V-type ATPase subunit [Flavonifractor plautii]
MSKIRDTDYLTISARVRAMENRLVTRERMERMVEARSDDEAVKVLTECGYEELPALTNRGLDELLSAARAALYRELGGAVPDKRLVELFQMKYDYHNAKALVKGAAVGADADRLLMEGGRWSAAQVKEAFQRDSLREFTDPFRRAVVQARETLNGGNDPQLADFVLDRAYFAEMAETARAVGSPFLEGYVRSLIDAANLRSAVRCARMGKGSDFLSQVLLPGEMWRSTCSRQARAMIWRRCSGPVPSVMRRRPARPSPLPAAGSSPPLSGCATTR